jgi:uncharacterized protein YfaP (DUF2135 family)
MEYRITLRAAALMSCLSLSAVAATAQSPDASISGPRAGTNVEPSAAVQKQFDDRSVRVAERERVEIIGGAISAGAPGAEGGRGTQSGRAPDR